MKAANIVPRIYNFKSSFFFTLQRRIANRTTIGQEIWEDCFEGLTKDSGLWSFWYATCIRLAECMGCEPTSSVTHAFGQTPRKEEKRRAKTTKVYRQI